MIQIRKAELTDIQSIHDMAEIAFRHTYFTILSPEQIEYMMDWMYSLDNLKKQFEQGHVYYIAYRDDQPCGYVSIQPDGYNEQGRELFHLQKIYVLPSAQSNGIGRVLLDKALEHVKTASSGPASIELNVNRNNSAIGFYHRFGFKILRQGDFHIGNGYYMNDYIMGLDM